MCVVKAYIGVVDVKPCIRKSKLLSCFDNSVTEEGDQRLLNICILAIICGKEHVRSARVIEKARELERVVY